MVSPTLCVSFFAKLSSRHSGFSRGAPHACYCNGLAGAGWWKGGECGSPARGWPNSPNGFSRGVSHALRISFFCLLVLIRFGIGFYNGY